MTTIERNCQGTVITTNDSSDLALITCGLRDLFTKYRDHAQHAAQYPDPDDPNDLTWWADHLDRLKAMLEQLGVRVK